MSVLAHAPCITMDISYYLAQLASCETGRGHTRWGNAVTDCTAADPPALPFTQRTFGHVIQGFKASPRMSSPVASF
jgi:hypothetical protein